MMIEDTEDLFDEGKLKREIAQALTDDGMPLKSALNVAAFVAHLMVENQKLSELLSWLTTYVVSDAAVRDGMRTRDDMRKAFTLVTSMREGAKKHVVDGFTRLDHHKLSAKLVALVADSKWDEAIEQVRLASLGSTSTKD